MRKRIEFFVLTVLDGLFVYWQVPLPLHLPLVVPEMKHRAFVLLNVAGPQNLAVADPLHRGNL